jgi:UDP-N-acetylglucosamine transferase subunit ALG13
MIFVTVGTNEAPFDRLLAALAELGPGPDLLVQTGASAIRPPGARCVEFLPYDEVVEAMRDADVVVTHAGVGSVLTALSVGKRPVVVPRLRRFGEAVDDHQLELARQLAGSGLVRVVEDPAAIGTALEPVDVGERIELGPSHRLVSELRAYLAEAIGPPDAAHDPRYSR